ncbi:uncharacterized protein LOC134793836 [Cydia splendana]|uniref:uncharacterized protein LOC134793836 n=1 Tax=Cydia splendana TaxID=1100963 RepID=UPI00300CB40C
MSLLFLLLLSVMSSKEAITQKLSIIRRTNDRTYTMPDRGSYRFSDNEKVSMDCVLNCTECLAEKNYILNFYLHGSGHSRMVTVKANSTGKVSRTFTLHKNQTEIVCDATYLGFDGLSFSPNRSTVKLQYVSPTREDNPRKGKHLEPWLESPKISPSVFKDTGAASAMFTCTVSRERLALLSWHQMKGTERVLLKTVSLPNTTSDTIYYWTLNKTLSESDRDTGLYCVARYYLEGKLSERVISKRISLALNRTVEATFEGRRVLSNAGSLALLAAICSVAIVALILVVILATVIVKYRRKVKIFERDEALRNREPLPLPPNTDDIYEPVYGHGAGLKRPRTRPKVTRD